MIAGIVFWAFARIETARTPAIYRFPASEAGFKGVTTLLDDDAWDALCVEPAPPPDLRERALGNVKFVEAKTIDTTANLKWRNAAIAFANGKTSTAAFLAATKGLGETVHFLTSPKTPTLRDATPSHTGDGTYSARSVFAEFLLLQWPGRVCMTSTDLWLTKELPENPQHESWVLAMRDRLGPSLVLRAEEPAIVHAKPTIVRADAKPGLLIWKIKGAKKTYTFAMNNADVAVPIPAVNVEHLLGLYRGLDLDGKVPTLQPTGFYIQED